MCPTIRLQKYQVTYPYHPPPIRFCKVSVLYKEVFTVLSEVSRLRCVFQVTVCSWWQPMSLVTPLAWSTLRTPEPWWPPFTLTPKTSDFLRMTSKASRSSTVRWNVTFGWFPRQGLSPIPEQKQCFSHWMSGKMNVLRECKNSGDFLMNRCVGRQAFISNPGPGHSNGHM